MQVRVREGCARRNPPRSERLLGSLDLEEFDAGYVARHAKKERTRRDFFFLFVRGSGQGARRDEPRWLVWLGEHASFTTCSLFCTQILFVVGIIL